jgi:hypothetical protein
MVEMQSLDRGRVQVFLQHSHELKPIKLTDLTSTRHTHSSVIDSDKVTHSLLDVRPCQDVSGDVRLEIWNACQWHDEHQR